MTDNQKTATFTFDSANVNFDAMKHYFGDYEPSNFAVITVDGTKQLAVVTDAEEGRLRLEPIAVLLPGATKWISYREFQAAAFKQWSLDTFGEDS